MAAFAGVSRGRRFFDQSQSGDWKSREPDARERVPPLCFVFGLFVFGAAFPALLLFSDFFAAEGLGALCAELLFFEQGAEAAARMESVERLRAGVLDFDVEAGGGVAQLDAGGGFVDLLAAGAAAANEGLFEVVFAESAGFHAGA